MWLASHRSVWKFDPIGDYVPSLIAHMHEQHGDIVLNVKDTFAVFYDGHHQFSAKLPAQDLTALRASLGDQATANQRLERP